MLNAYLAGCAFVGFCVVALFFLKFWVKSNESLFLMFAIAFALFGVERIVHVFVPVGAEKEPLVYLIRLAAFCILIAGIVAKNRR